MLVPVNVDMFTAAFLRLTRMSVTAADVPQDGSVGALCINAQWLTTEQCVATVSDLLSSRAQHWPPC